MLPLAWLGFWPLAVTVNVVLFEVVEEPGAPAAGHVTVADVGLKPEIPAGLAGAAILTAPLKGA